MDSPSDNFIAKNGWFELYFGVIWDEIIVEIYENTQKKECQLKSIFGLSEYYMDRWSEHHSFEWRKPQVSILFLSKNTEGHFVTKCVTSSQDESSGDVLFSVSKWFEITGFRFSKVHFLPLSNLEIALKLETNITTRLILTYFSVIKRHLTTFGTSISSTEQALRRSKENKNCSHWPVSEQFNFKPPE